MLSRTKLTYTQLWVMHLQPPKLLKFGERNSNMILKEEMGRLLRGSSN